LKTQFYEGNSGLGAGIFRYTLQELVLGRQKGCCGLQLVVTVLKWRTIINIKGWKDLPFSLEKVFERSRLRLL
jgi:hypothetical protein